MCFGGRELPVWAAASPGSVGRFALFPVQHNNQTRTSPFGSDISAGCPTTIRGIIGTLIQTARYRRSKTANTRRLTRTNTTLFYEKLKFPSVSLEAVFCPQESWPKSPRTNSIANMRLLLQVEKSSFSRRRTCPGATTRKHEPRQRRLG